MIQDGTSGSTHKSNRKRIWAPRLTAASFTKAKAGTAQVSGDGGINRMRYIYAIERSLSFQRKGILIPAATWRSPEGVMPSGTSRSQEGETVILLVWGTREGSDPQTDGRRAVPGGRGKGAGSAC